MVPMASVKPPTFPTFPESVPIVAWHPWTDIRRRDDMKRLNISFPFGTMPPEWTLKIRQSYYAASLYVDALIGQLLKYVDKTNTVIVITSDHGWSLGENGMWAKYSNFDVALKVPLIFNIPETAPRVVDTPVELIDIFPTILDLVNLNKDIPNCKGSNDKALLCFEGKSLVSLMKGSQGKIEKAFAISQYPRPSVYPEHNSDKPRLREIKIMGYSIRTKKYRYTEWISFNSSLFTKDWNTIHGIELYDHEMDPDESYNIFDCKTYLHTRKKLSKMLRTQVNL
ncbi:iduronate 2-sulfatase [Leptidea sinapis]|uniref:iduronate 2-sulfatase n=1 Tax=Leptidea sinapis TaxID=189913 RepID=UPI00212A9F3A|nr:iduronate 2-sulfatase [Leptidea sinapis]